MEHDIYYYLELARKQIKMEQQANRDYMICQMNNTTIPITDNMVYKDKTHPYGLVPRL